MRTNEMQTAYILMLRDKKIKEKREMKKNISRYIPVAACFCIILSAVVLINASGLLGANNKASDLTENTSETTTAYISPSDIPVIYRYGMCTIGGVGYSSQKSKIKDEYIEGYFGDGETYYLKDNEKQYAVCRAYKIKGINESAAMAFSFEGEEGFYIAYNAEYSPETLGGLFSDLGLAENMTEGEAVKYIYSDSGNKTIPVKTDKNSLMKLFTDSTVKKEGAYKGYSYKLATVSISSEAFGDNKMELTVYGDGILSVAFVGYRMTFDIGQDAVNSFHSSIGE